MSKVHIFGSIICDLVASGPALPARGETLLGTSFAQYPGGKGANQAVASHRAGAPTTIYGATGDDEAARFMRAAIKDAGLSLDQIATVDAPTGTALVMVGPDTNQIMVIPGANHQASWPPSHKPEIHSGDVLLAQGECPAQATEAFLTQGKLAGALTLLNAAPAGAAFTQAAQMADILILNEIEAAFFATHKISDIPSRIEMMSLSKHLGRSKAQPLIITLGALGLVSLIDHDHAHHPAPKVTPVDTVGAGDCFCGYLAAQLAMGASLIDSLDVASKAAALSITRAGAIPSLPTIDELK